MVNVDKLKGKIIENKLNVESLGKLIGEDKSTIYRKMADGGDDFTVGEVVSISNALHLNISEINAIFYPDFVA